MRVDFTSIPANWTECDDESWAVSRRKTPGVFWSPFFLLLESLSFIWNRDAASFFLSFSLDFDFFSFPSVSLSSEETKEKDD